jgi:hypothetical protein
VARSLGSLVVNLGLNAAEYTTGLTVAEARARKFAKSVDEGIATAAKAGGIALAALATGAIAAFKAMDGLAKQAGEFQDLAEMTGANAEALASFAVAAGVAGTDMSTLADASVKLTKSLTDVTDESSDAGAALKALGIPIGEFKALDPATQIETVAKALAGFEDGASKTAVAVALFGKSGAQLLPFLKELAAQGGRQVILTQRQIELADQYADAQAKARTELNLYAQAAATQALPAVTAITGAVKDFVKELVDVDGKAKQLRDGDAVRSFAETAATALGFLVDAGDGVVRVFQGMGIVIGAGLASVGAATSGNLQGARDVIRGMYEDLDKLANRQLFSARLAKQLADARANDAARAREDRGFTPKGNQLNFSGGVKEAKATAEKQSEAEKYIDTLYRQLEGTFELSEVEKAQIKIWEMARDARSGLNDANRQAMLDVAAQLDYQKQAKKAAEEQKRLDEDTARTRERISQMVTKEIETAQQAAASLRENNERQEEQLILLRDGDAALDLYIDKKNAKAAAELRDKAAMQENAGAAQALIDATKAQAAEYERARSIAGATRFVETIKKEAEAIKALQQDVFGIGAHAVEDLILNGAKASDVLKQLERDLVAFMTRQSLLTLQNAMIPGSSGPTLWDVLGKVVGAAIGGYSVPSGGIAPGFGYGEKYALGGTPGPGWALVGERGPELVNFSGGERVYSNADSQLMLGGTHITINQTVMPGASTASARQAAANARDAVMWAVRDR